MVCGFKGFRVLGLGFRGFWVLGLGLRGPRLYGLQTVLLTGSG